MKFFISTKQTPLTDQELTALVPGVKWITLWESIGEKVTRLGEIEESYYQEVKSILSRYYNVYEDVQFNPFDRNQKYGISADDAEYLSQEPVPPRVMISVIIEEKQVSKLEYIWLDGCKPVQGLRSKTKVQKVYNTTPSSILERNECPVWSFDGSSTEQASGGSSDCLLKPVHVVKDPQRKNAYLVMCEVLNPDGTPHETNARATINDDSDDYWFGFEQEYFLWDPKTNKPLGFPVGGYPNPQGPYYCSVGAANAFGRNIVEEHFDTCLEAEINIEGINAEVAPGQWEFQVFAKGAKAAGDQLWLARYLLERTAEKYGVAINWHCKPLGTLDWNGSGMHTNFSNTLLRTCGSKEVYDKVCEAFRPVVKEHIEVYGPDNHLRLTGKHETAAIDQFKYGVSDRGASIRIPIATVQNNWNGWLEDRRPNSAADPYKVAARIVKTLQLVK